MVNGSGGMDLLRSLPAVNPPAPVPVPDVWASCARWPSAPSTAGPWSGSLAGGELVWHQQRAVLDDRALVAVDPGPHGGTLDFLVTSADLAVLGIGSEGPVEVRGHDVTSAQLFASTLAEA